MAMTPTPQQQAVIDWARTGYGSCNVQALAGTGKCLGRGTPVIKFDGTIVPVESIKPNDLLMGPDSTPRQVESISRGVGPLYRITPIKGDSWICNDAHIMTLMGTNNKSGVIIDTPLSECLKHPDANGRLDKQWKLFRVPLSFTESEIPYDAYMIGSWLGDGTIHEPLWTLGLKKESILKYLSDLAPTMNFRPVVKWDDRTNTWNLSYRIRFHGEKGRVRYEKHPFKSYINEHLMIEGEKRIPRCYLMNTNVVRKSIFAGLMDTDGHQSSPTTFDFVTKYKGLSEDVLFLSRSLGLAAYCTEKQVKLEAWSEPRVYYRISISGSFESYPFLRHSINARQQVKDVLKTGWAAEPIGVGEYFGFTLSGDGRFLLGDFTVTHNTSLLMMIAAVISGKALFCAFNKAIAEELKSRLLPYPHCEGATLHSVGLRLFRKLRTKFEVESRKVRFIARDVVGPYNKKAVDVVVAAVDSAKQTGVGIPGYPHWSDEQTWMGIFDADEDLTDELPSDFSLTRAYESCQQVYKKSMAMCEDKQAVIDFNDMLLAPLVMGGTGSWMESYDWVLCDEGQDLNETRRLLASRVLRKSGRFVLVGDSHQAIYGFSGADSNSMELMKKALNYEQEFPLSVTYRCPKSVVELSHQWVPDYEAAEQNQEGLIRTIQHDQFWKEDFSPDDVVICRNTRPLVGIAKRLRKANIPCIVEGYSPKGLIAMAEKWGDITIEGFISKVTDYRDAEVEKLERKKKEEKADALRDKVATLLELCEDLNPDDGVRALVSLIEKLFGQGQNGEDLDVLHLCTAHRCVTGDTLVETPNGLERIKDLSEQGHVYCGERLNPFIRKFQYQNSEVFHIVTKRGYELETTSNHGLTVWRNGKHVRVETYELVVGDLLRVRLGTDFDVCSLVKAPAACKGAPQEKTYKTPFEVDDDFAEFLGMMVADGTVFTKGFRLVKRYKSVISRFKELCESLFGCTPSAVEHNYDGTPACTVSSTFLARWLLSVGGLIPGNKSIPICILHSPLYIQAGFLRGLFEDGTVNVKKGMVDHVHFDTIYHDLARTVQTMLLRFGIVSSVKRHPSTPGREITTVYIYSDGVRIFGNQIGFVSKEKNQKLRSYPTGKNVRSTIPITKLEAKAARKAMSEFDYRNALMRGYISVSVANKIVQADLGVVDRVILIDLRDRMKWAYLKVESVEPSGNKDVYCVEVPNKSRFLQNGFDGWNSKGREWDRVYLVGRNAYMPSYWATKSEDPEALQQEENLQYVAVTRTKEELVEVVVPVKKRGSEGPDWWEV